LADETVYEGMFLLDSNRYGRDPEGVSGQVPGMIQEAGGEVLVSRMWEERRLAFPIKGRRKGTYWLTYFRMDGGKLGDLKRKSQLNENVLRALFIKVDPRIVDTLVEHAQVGEGKKATVHAEEKKAESTEKASKKEEKKAESTEEASKKEEKKAESTEEASKKEENKAESTEEAPKKTEEPANQEDAAAEADSGKQAASEDKAD